MEVIYLKDKSVFVQGIGHVGESFVEHLTNEGAKVTIADINQERLEEVRSKYDVTTIYRWRMIFTVRTYGYLCTLCFRSNNQR